MNLESTLPQLTHRGKSGLAIASRKSGAIPWPVSAARAAYCASRYTHATAMRLTPVPSASFCARTWSSLSSYDGQGDCDDDGYGGNDCLALQVTCDTRASG